MVQNLYHFPFVHTDIYTLPETENMTLSGDVSTDISAYDLEYRAPIDDAWYSVRVVLDGEKLTLKYFAFPDTSDERFNAGDFKTPEAVDEFCQRFRPVSSQVQDNQCSTLVEGVTVCSSFTFKDDDIRFHDAIVEAVHHEEHSFVKEEEECLCTFVLFWQHGPNVGNLTYTKISNICLVQSGAQLDPRVASFSKMAKEKIATTSCKSSSVSDGGFSLCKGGTREKEKCCLSIKPESRSFQYRLQEVENAGQFGGLVCTAEGRIGKFYEQSDNDRDVGGKSVNINSIGETGSHYFILIENLEKDLSPFSIMEFIHKETSISPQAYVFPSLSSESYTRGTIVLDCKNKLQKINEFLDNPDHVIMSLRGRPWVKTEKILRRGTFRTALWSFMPKSQYKFQSQNVDNELKVVQSGTEEYKTAKQLIDLFMDFVDHQRRLHRRLSLEESKILQTSYAV